MSVEAPEQQRQKPETMSASMLRLQREQIIDQYRAYFQETFKEKKVAGARETAMTEEWIRTQKATEEGVTSLRDFYEKFLRKQLASGRSLHSRFHSSISSAVENKWISRTSYEKWVRRFEDPAASYKDREQWVEQDMPVLLERWKIAAQERRRLAADADFKALASRKPAFADILSEEKFLSLHYDDRHSLLASARASMLATEKNQEDIYEGAKHKLQSAVSAGILSSAKVGMWLERIFKSNANPQKIHEFVSGTGPTSLHALTKNWAAVKGRFDVVEKKFKERGEEAAARGFTMKTPQQFLAMHYAQRLSYVKQAEDRLDDAEHVINELPIFLKIRHAMDMKDWTEASELIADAKLMHLKDSDWPRLKSMEKHISQFKGKEVAGGIEKASGAKKRLDELMERFGQSHSEMQPLVSRLLRGPNANRSIHQLRWMWYNNIWCRTHGSPYLTDQIARKGSSEDNEQLTKYRAEQGLDIGRHDTIDYETADQAYYRKQEDARHTATFMHVNVNSGGVQSAFAEKLEHEQDPRWLYWTTLCPHSNGDPKSEAWMREGLLFLTEMRSLTKNINGSGFMYDGSGRPLIGMN